MENEPRNYNPGRHYFDFNAPRLRVKQLRASFSRDPDAQADGVPDPRLAAVVTPRSPLSLRIAVEKLAVCFLREMGFDFRQFEAEEENPDDYRAFLWAHPDGLDAMFAYPDKVNIVGAAVFRWRRYSDAPDAYALQWVWLHPYARRKGLLSTAWPYFIKRFGPFVVEGPLSEAMQAFVKKNPMPWPTSVVDEGSAVEVQESQDAVRELEG